MNQKQYETINQLLELFNLRLINGTFNITNITFDSLNPVVHLTDKTEEEGKVELRSTWGKQNIHIQIYNNNQAAIEMNDKGLSKRISFHPENGHPRKSITCTGLGDKILLCLRLKETLMELDIALADNCRIIIQIDKSEEERNHFQYFEQIGDKIFRIKLTTLQEGIGIGYISGENQEFFETDEKHFDRYVKEILNTDHLKEILRIVFEQLNNLGMRNVCKELGNDPLFHPYIQPLTLVEKLQGLVQPDRRLKQIIEDNAVIGKGRQKTLGR